MQQQECRALALGAKTNTNSIIAELIKTNSCILVQVWKRGEDVILFDVLLSSCSKRAARRLAYSSEHEIDIQHASCDAGGATQTS
eukprot:1153494-Pelagomonas_calceolata.AAC.2